MRIAVIAAGALMVLAGCASSARAEMDPPATVPATRAEQLAQALAAAASADASGDRQALGQAVALIDRLGAHPLDGVSDDPLGAWRSNAAFTDPPLRGRPLGPGYRSGRIAAGSKESFAQLFLSGTGAQIAVSAPNGGRVAMRVIDPQAKTICKGEANRGGTCRWVPLFTQRYTIEVANLSNEDVRYFLVVD